MSTVRTTHSLNVGYIKVKIGQPGGPMGQDLDVRALRVQAAAKQRLRQSPQRIDTGNLLNSIQVRIYQRNGMPVARIGTDVEYSIYVHEGTMYMKANPFLKAALKAGKGTGRRRR